MSGHEADEYNQSQLDLFALEGRHLTRLTEHWQRDHFLKVDGKCGPVTLESVLGDEFVDMGTDPIIQTWEPFHGPLAKLPSNRSDVYELLGNPANGGKPDKKWVKENIRTYRKDHALPGVDPHRYVKMHKLMEPYAREALLRAASVSDYKITRFGDYVFRLMRSANRLSYHSFGWAFDINSQDNFPRRYDSAEEAPKPWMPEWYDTWPNGMDRAFVEAIKSVGFSWGGDWKTFKDPMHFELVL